MVRLLRALPQAGVTQRSRFWATRATASPGTMTGGFVREPSTAGLRLRLA